MWTVYQHISPSGKVYVGITSNIKDRWRSKGYYYCTYNSIMKRVILKYGWDNIRHKVIHSNLSFNEAIEYEKYYIAKYKKEGISYNITDGGQGTLGRVCSDSTKAKLSLSNKGVCRKAIESSIVERKTLTKEERQRRYSSFGMRGKHHTKETKLKMSKSAKGRNMTKAVEISSKLSKKPVIVYREDLVIGIFNSYTEASKALNVNKANISRAIKLNIKAGGYKFYNYVS